MKGRIKECSKWKNFLLTFLFSTHEFEELKFQESTVRSTYNWSSVCADSAALCQCRGEGAYALENVSESREVEPISSDLRSEATEEEGIGSTSRDEDAFLVCKHPPHGINIVIRKNSP